MKSKLFGNKPPLPHRHPNSCPTPPTGPQHAPHSQTYPPRPSCILPPFRLPPFSQDTTSHALGKQTPTQPFQKGLSESQALWQAKRFRDYWQKKSGKEALKVNWQAP
ncbi:hypothetical protein [Bartonella sp. AP36NXGY]|uniref:hypothetical protein n=1 Tax=Bartonella sp. AP36NXGY TaxID=3243493 RepID=UPI0035CEA297